MKSSLTGYSDSLGAYVLTDENDLFSIDSVAGSTTTYDYICPTASTQVYLYAAGGNPGAGTNAAATFLAALGSCGDLNSSKYAYVNEITTVAAAYALSGFATDALHVSIPQYATNSAKFEGTVDTLAQTGLQNALWRPPTW